MSVLARSHDSRVMQLCYMTVRPNKPDRHTVFSPSIEAIRRNKIFCYLVYRNATNILGDLFRDKYVNQNLETIIVNSDKYRNCTVKVRYIGIDGVARGSNIKESPISQMIIKTFLLKPPRVSLSLSGPVEVMAT